MLDIPLNLKYIPIKNDVKRALKSSNIKSIYFRKFFLEVKS